MPPAVGRMHASHPSNPFAHLNPAQSIPQSHYQQHQQGQAIPQSLARPSAYAVSNPNGSISPFAQPTGSIPLQGTYPGGAIGAGGGSGLASEAAYRGFAHGAALQQQQAHQQEAAQLGLKSGAAARIRDVWAGNFEAEMVILRELITKYPYVSMVTTTPPFQPAVLLTNNLCRTPSFLVLSRDPLATLKTRPRTTTKPCAATSIFSSLFSSA